MTWVTVGWVASTGVILGYSVWRAALGPVVYATLGFVLENYYAAIHGAAVAGPVPWAGVCAFCDQFLPYTWQPMLRVFPALLLVEAMALGWALRRRSGRVEIVRMCCWGLAVAMSVSILYYPDFIHVAFIAPFVLLVAARLAHALRSLRVWERRPLAAAVPRLVLIIVVLATMAKGWANLAYAWSQAPEQFESAMGPLRGDAEERHLLEAVQQVLSQRPANQRSLFSYPADAWLYLAAPADNPTAFALLLPGYNTPEQFRAARAALMQRPVDCLVVNTAVGRGDPDPVNSLESGRYRRVATVGAYEVYGRSLQP